MQNELTQVAWSANSRDDNLHEHAFRDMGGSFIASLKFFPHSLYEILLEWFTLLEVDPEIRVGLIIFVKHVQALINADIKQVFECALNHFKWHLAFEVGVDQMPEIIHMIDLILKATVHEASEEKFSRLMDTANIAEIRITE